MNSNKIGFACYFSSNKLVAIRCLLEWEFGINDHDLTLILWFPNRTVQNNSSILYLGLKKNIPFFFAFARSLVGNESNKNNYCIKFPCCKAQEMLVLQKSYQILSAARSAFRLFFTLTLDWTFCCYKFANIVLKSLCFQMFIQSSIPNC